MTAFLANCLHGLEALGPGRLWTVMGALYGRGFAWALFGKSHGPLMRGLAAGLFVLNGVVLAVMAVRMLG
jgi:hypothetical protein